MNYLFLRTGSLRILPNKPNYFEILLLNLLLWIFNELSIVKLSN